LKCFSLFSGIGGFDLALTRQGHTMVGACEIDKYARSIYSRHFPNVPVWEDATKINPSELPDFEMLCAGFPCQAFSLAGRRLGFEDTRGTLFYEIVRIAREKRPGIILLENVKGLLYHDDGRTLTTIIKTFYELGYDIEWQVINGKYFLPQNRDRIYIIGYSRENPRSKIFPLGEINPVNDGTHSKTQGERKRIRSPYTRTIDSNYAKGGGSRTMIAVPKLKQVGHIDTKGHNSMWGRVYDPDGISSTINSQGGGLGAKTGLYTVPVLCVNRNNRRQNGRRFKTDGEPSFTITTIDRHGIYDGKNIRSLTPLECERLQGFPDDYTKGISDTQRYKCIGNAVMVPVVEEIVRYLE